MKYIIIPGTNKRLAEGSIISIPRLPNEVYTVRNGWYNYQNQDLNGWYFSSTSGDNVFPINEQDLRDLVVISSPCPSPSSPNSCSCPPPPPPCPPPHPFVPDIVKSIERYSSGKYYFSDQLLYMEEGILYQTTKKFRSSWEFDSLAENFESDITQGNLIPVADQTATEEKIQTIESEIVEIHENINVIDNKLVRKYFLNFISVFGTDTPSKSDADIFLSALDPPVIPGINISFTNSDEESETYGHIFTYYPDPDDLNNLIFRDDTISGGGSDSPYKIYTTVESVPEPTPELKGTIIQYIGDTHTTLSKTFEPKQGHLYICDNNKYIKVYTIAPDVTPETEGIYYTQSTKKPHWYNMAFLPDDYKPDTTYYSESIENIWHWRDISPYHKVMTIQNNPESIDVEIFGTGPSYQPDLEKYRINGSIKIDILDIDRESEEITNLLGEDIGLSIDLLTPDSYVDSSFSSLNLWIYLIEGDVSLEVFLQSMLDEGDFLECQLMFASSSQDPSKIPITFYVYFDLYLNDEERANELHYELGELLRNTDYVPNMSITISKPSQGRSN